MGSLAPGANVDEMVEKAVRWRQPLNVHLRSQARRDKHDPSDELTLRAWSAGCGVSAAAMGDSLRASGAGSAVA